MSNVGDGRESNVLTDASAMTTRVRADRAMDAGTPLSMRLVFAPAAVPARHWHVPKLLDGTKLKFGRSSSQVDVTLPDPALSRVHFEIRPGMAGIPFVRDLKSNNGTYLRGVRLDPDKEMPLAQGDVLAAGDCLWAVDGEVDPESLPAVAEARGADVPEVVGQAPLTERLRQSIATVGPLEDAVLLLGETGTGKEVAAAAIHRLSERRGPFVPVNCAAIPPELAEATLFGHVKGAFSGATGTSEGFFRRADGGTLFLDELGELPMAMQAKLLRVVENGEVWPVGATRGRKVNVRLVAATNKDLGGDGFRDDLLIRLSDWTLHLPPLRDRVGDAVVLLAHFLRADGGPTSIEPEAREAVALYAWPGNVRQLRKLAGRLKTLVPAGGAVRLEHLIPKKVQAPIRARVAAEAARLQAEREEGTPGRERIVSALAEARGNVTRAAEANGWHRTQLYRWLRRFDIDPRDYR
ncbi:MAG: sigma 54-interacting transcriptional regulator [Myxococcota bacterium]